jgi:hypothetical protein
LLPAAALLCISGGREALAAQDQPAAPHQLVLQGEQAVQVALRALLIKQRWKDGLALIAHLPPEVRDRSAYLYLRAQLLRKVGQRHEAIDIYNRLLSRDQTQQLIRLELAQTYYEVNDDRAAEQYFRLALSGPLTPADAAQAHQYLVLIRKRSGWHMSASASLAPDSNVNGATSAQSIELFGLPFQLADQARERASWVGGVSGAVDRSFAIAGPLRLEGQAYGQEINNFSAHAFDQLVLGARAGPQWVFGERSISLLGGFERLRYGGATLYDMENLTARAELPTSATVLYRLTVAEQRYTYHLYSDYDGWLTNLGVERTQFLTPTSFWRVTVNGSDDEAAANYQSYRSGQVAVGYYHTLPLGLAAYVEPSAAVNAYLAPQPLFGVRRVDALTALSARLILRDHTVWGFAPYTGVQVLRVKSSIDLYSYDRARLEAGFARTF